MASEEANSSLAEAKQGVSINDTELGSASGDGTVASKLVELSLKATQAQIEAPSVSGQMLLELGYRTVGGDFITLEYSFIDLGPKKIVQPELTNWFSNESDNIHQDMYDLATKGRSLGGSEVMPHGR